MTEINSKSLELLNSVLNSIDSPKESIFKEILELLNTLNEDDSKFLILGTSKLVCYSGDFRNGKSRRDNFLKLFIFFYKYFPEVAIKLIVVLDKIQYTKIYFLLLNIIINKSSEEFEPLKRAILSKTSNVFFKLKDVCNKSLQSSEEITPYFLNMLQAWIKHFPNKVAKLFGNGSHNDKRKKKRNIEQGLARSVKLTTELFNLPQHKFCSNINEIYSILFELELFDKKKILEEHEIILQKKNYADNSIQQFVSSFEDEKIRDSPEFSSIFSLKKENFSIDTKLNIRNTDLHDISHSATINELIKIDMYKKLFKCQDNSSIYIRRKFNKQVYNKNTKKYINIGPVYDNIFNNTYKNLVNKDKEYLSLQERLSIVNLSLEEAYTNLLKLKEEIIIQSNELSSELKKNEYYTSLLEDANRSNQIINDIYEKLNHDNFIKCNQLLIEKLKEYHDSLSKDK